MLCVVSKARLQLKPQITIYFEFELIQNPQILKRCCLGGVEGYLLQSSKRIEAAEKALVQAQALHLLLDLFARRLLLSQSPFPVKNWTHAKIRFLILNVP